MLDIDSFSSVIAQIYDASLSVERWDDVLASLARLFNSPKAQISYYASFQDAYPFFRFWGFAEGELERSLTKYRELALTDPRMPPKLFKAYHCRQIISDEGLRSTAMYREALAPARIEYAMFFGLDFDDGGKCAVSLMRGPDRQAFSAEECDDFGRFIPHVSRAVTIHGTLRRARGEAAAAQALIDGVPLGMMVVDDDRVVLANAAARALLKRGDSLHDAGGRLRATTPQADARLGEAMREAQGGGDRPIGVTLPAGKAQPLRAVVRKLGRSTAGLLGARPDAVALYLADSRRPLETSEELLRRLFGLTAREASVLRALVEGGDTRGIARRLGIGAETVKTHLRHVMQAVGARRQAELIRLVLSSPAWIAATGASAATLPLQTRPARRVVRSPP
jgi:DNA-binding CsgD family transcriptional regulator/PAS domain-containing protein